MSAELHVYSEMPPLSWANFVASHPIGSIALDGYVKEPPLYEPDGHYLNADHHAGVDRLATYSTAQQLFVKIRMGLREAFTRDGIFGPHVFANDCDQDVALAWFLLDNIDAAENPSPELNGLVETAGRLDATAGAWPCDLKTREQLAWVFEPYTDFKASGGLQNHDNDQYTSVIYGIGERIHAHLRGQGRSVELETDYEVIGGGPGWSMIVEHGKDGRIGAFQEGIKAYIIVKKLAGGKWRDTVGKVSEFVTFNVPKTLARFNFVEGCVGSASRWDGSNLVGGSPRPYGTDLPPGVLEEEANRVNYRRAA